MAKTKNKKTYQVHDPVQVQSEELLLNVPVRMIVRHPLVLHVGGEPFVQPQVIPPLQGHKVAEPLKINK